MPITLPELPYDPKALEPHMSERTLQFHHGKHHKTYVDKTNSLIEGTELEGEGLEDIIRKAAGDKDKAGLFNNAAQVWNHTFFWNCMSPDGGGVPRGQLAEQIEADFGDIPAFKKAFSEAATGRFGSGWAWLVLRNGKAEITSTPNADNPMVSGSAPLLTCDVWEHAYYLDYQNDRAKFVTAFLDELVNWDFVTKRYEQSRR